MKQITLEEFATLKLEEVDQCYGAILYRVYEREGVERKTTGFVVCNFAGDPYSLYEADRLLDAAKHYQALRDQYK